METKNSTYLILTIILVILSAIGGFFLFQLKSSSNTVSKVTPTPIPKIELIPTETFIPKITATPSAKISPITTPTTKITPQLTPTLKPTLTSTITPTPVSSASASILTLSRPDDGFSIDYSSARRLYQDTEPSGNRYTFYLSSGNFAVHVGLNNQWAWTNPNRNFSGDLLVAGLNTFRYDIPTQTIVDLQSNGKNYTIQCVHNGNAVLEDECEEFIESFKLL